jgi:hypothetical protein
MIYLYIYIVLCCISFYYVYNRLKLHFDSIEDVVWYVLDNIDKEEYNVENVNIKFVVFVVTLFLFIFSPIMLLAKWSNEK